MSFFYISKTFYQYFLEKMVCGHTAVEYMVFYVLFIYFFVCFGALWLVLCFCVYWLCLFLCVFVYENMYCMFMADIVAGQFVWQ